MTARRSGPIVAATWLIGIGLVLLAREWLNVSWSEAWPLFVVLLGAIAFVARAVRGGPAARWPAALWSFTWPVAWIVVGVILLASTTGRLASGPLETLDSIWPWAAIALGAWFLIGAVAPFAGPAVEALARPIGTLREAAIRIRFGGGELQVRDAAPGQLVEGTFRGGVVCHDLGPGRIELEQDTTWGMPWIDHIAAWDVGLGRGIPLDVRIESGASRSVLDLTDLTVRSLDLRTGASQTRLRLPRAAGATAVHAQTGAAEVVVEVPDGVAARVRSRMGLGSTSVDEARFPRTAAGFHESPDYATAANRVDLEIEGGLGAVRVVTGPAIAAA